MLLPLTEGPLFELEDAADRLLALERKISGAKTHDAINDYLTKDQLNVRHSHEVLTPTPEETLYSGVYHRAYNPLFGKRPPSYPHRRSEKPVFDTRVGTEAGNQLGWEMFSPRDPAWPIRPREGFYHHLTTGQRCRIRKMMKSIPATRQDARQMLRHLLADKYGVPPWVIDRCCRT